MESRSPPQSSELHNGEETPCLPELVIIEEILPRLPVKALLKFRCVAKSWCALIGSKRFIKAHLKNSIKTSWVAHHWIFLDDVEKQFKQCCFPSMFDKPSPVHISHISDLGIDTSDVILRVGCCDGLVCLLLNWKRFILWNPTTKKFKNLPDLFNLIRVPCEVIGAYWFGFDELTDDYKVFGIVITHNLNDPPPNGIGMVYSLRSNSWKPIEADVIPFFDEGMGVQVGGKLHWCSYRCDIVSFDLNNHLCGEVELPSGTQESVLQSVGVIGGCLSAHLLHPTGDLDVWLMKEYGVKESWDKVVTIPWDKVLTIRYEGHPNIPNAVAVAPNGEVLLIRNSTVVIYNPKCDVLRHVQITGCVNESDIYSLGIYIGNLASIYSLGIYIESLASVAPDAH